MGTGWFAADAANVKPGKTLAVVGDGHGGQHWNNSHRSERINLR